MSKDTGIRGSGHARIAVLQLKNVDQQDCPFEDAPRLSPAAAVRVQGMESVESEGKPGYLPAIVGTRCTVTGDARFIAREASK
jgi:hypothetical protein